MTPRCMLNDPECPNPGWPVPCPKCNYCSQMDERQPLPTSEAAAVDEIISEEEALWTTPATDEDLAGQASDSRDLFSWDDDDDDEWWEDAEWYVNPWYEDETYETEDEASAASDDAATDDDIPW